MGASSIGFVFMDESNIFIREVSKNGFRFFIFFDNLRKITLRN